jgi:hypothetical protein
VRVFHHHDGGIDHRSDSDRDPAKGHNVGSQVEIINRNERKNDGDGQSDNGDQGAAHVEKKDDDHGADDQTFFDQFLF